MGKKASALKLMNNELLYYHLCVKREQDIGSIARNL